MYKKVSLALCLLLILAVSLPVFAQDEVVVRFRSWSPVIATTEAMIAAFNEANPDITIEPDITNYPEYLVDLQTMAAGGSLPDLIGLEPGALTQQYRDHLMPLQGLRRRHLGRGLGRSILPGRHRAGAPGQPRGRRQYLRPARARADHQYVVHGASF